MAKYFKKEEFECKCGCGLNIIDPRVIETADIIREALGVPLNVNSGTRCQFNNARSGGIVAVKYLIPGTKKLDLDKYPRGKAGTAKDSNHSLGQAADLSSNTLKSKQIWDRIQDLYKAGKLPYLAGLGLYTKSNFCHIDVQPKEKGRLREWFE
jgi:hypothetical protein